MTDQSLPLSWLDLELLELDLEARTAAALAAELGPEEMRALAAERDKLAAERDVLADSDDVSAGHRDDFGLHRDVQGSARDRAARDETDDEDAGWRDRYLAGTDRDFAAGDRADARDDRRQAKRGRHRAAQDRQQAADDRDDAALQAVADAHEIAGLQEALSTRLVIGQAEGLLMANYNLDGQTAFTLLVKLSQTSHVKLRVVAERIVNDHLATARGTTQESDAWQ